MKDSFRRKLRFQRPVQREHFYLYACLSGEEAPDENDFALKLARHIGEPGAAVEEVARKLRHRGAHVEWRQNLDYWSGTHITPRPAKLFISRKKIAVSSLAFLLASLTLVLCWLHVLFPDMQFAVDEVSIYLDDHPTYSFCDGPYIRLDVQDLAHAERVLLNSSDSTSKTCLAMLYGLQGFFSESYKLAMDVCISYEAAPLAQNVACGLTSFFQGKLHDCIKYRQDAVARACDELATRSSACWRAHLAAALASNLQGWDQPAREALLRMNQTGCPDDILFVSLVEMADNEMATGDAKLAMRMLHDMLPTAMQLASNPVQNSRAVAVLRVYAESLSWEGEHEEARAWFSRALDLSRFKWDRSMVFFEQAKMQLWWDTSVPEAIHLTEIGISMLSDISADDKSIFWYQPLRNQMLIANRTQHSIDLSLVTRLKELLVRYPFLYTQHEAQISVVGDIGKAADWQKTNR